MDLRRPGTRHTSDVIGLRAFTAVPLMSPRFTRILRLRTHFGTATINTLCPGDIHRHLEFQLGYLPWIRPEVTDPVRVIQGEVKY